MLIMKPGARANLRAISFEPLEGRLMLSADTGTISGRLVEANPYFRETRYTTPIAGATVFADRNANRLLDEGEGSAVTDADGNYRIEGVVPGTVEIRVGREGWSEYSLEP